MLGASIITFGIAQLIFPFIYNKIFIQSLVKKGFKAKSYEPIYKDSKRLNVKKEKAMIREEAGFGAEGISISLKLFSPGSFAGEIDFSSDNTGSPRASDCGRFCAGCCFIATWLGVTLVAPKAHETHDACEH